MNFYKYKLLLINSLQTSIIITFITSFLVPFQFLIAAPNDYILSLNFILNFLIIVFLIFLTLVSFSSIFFVFSKKFAINLLNFILLLALISLYLSPSPDVIDDNLFRDEELILKKNYFLNFFIISLSLILTLIIKYKFQNLKFRILVLLLCFPFFCSNILDLYIKKIGIFKIEKNILKIQDFSTDNSLEISDNQTNIIIMMLDMFAGGGIEKIFKSNRNLSSKFQDYIWYPDTLSVGRSTVVSELAIIAGHKKSAPYINFKNIINPTHSDSIEGMWEMAFNELGNLTRTGNVKLNIWAPNPYTKGYSQILDQFRVKEINIKCIDDYKIYKKYKQNLKKKPKLLEITQAYGVFYLLPPFTKKYFYKSYLWSFFQSSFYHIINPKQKNINLMNNINFNAKEKFKLINSIKNIKITKTQQKTITYINSNFTHSPFATSKKCFENVDIKKLVLDTNKVTKEFSHYQNMICALEIISNLSSVLKEQNAYDNTVIILVSDHDNDGKILSKKLDKNIIKGYGPQALLMIKHLKSNHTFKTDKSLMSNKDIIKIVRCYLKLNVKENNLCLPKISKRFRFTTSTPSHITYQNYHTFKINRISRVKGNMFLTENWEETNEKDPLIDDEYKLFE